MARLTQPLQPVRRPAGLVEAAVNLSIVAATATLLLLHAEHTTAICITIDSHLQRRRTMSKGRKFEFSLFWLLESKFLDKLWLFFLISVLLLLVFVQLVFSPGPPLLERTAAKWWETFILMMRWLFLEG